MVSGLITSPYDQPRISSEEAILSWMKSKSLDRGSRVRGKSIILKLSGSFKGHVSEKHHLYDLVLAERYAQTKRLQFLHEHVERLRNPRLGQILALDDCFIDARAAGHVVRLHGQDLLERVRGTVCFECPHFHFAETLATELCLAGQRLLRDKRVWSD